MSTATRVCRVAVDVLAVERLFDYSVPEALAGVVGVGTIVRVNLGGRRVRGWVVADDVVSEAPAAKLRPLAAAVSAGPSARDRLADRLGRLALRRPPIAPPPGRLAGRGSRAWPAGAESGRVLRPGNRPEDRGRDRRTPRGRSVRSWPPMPPAPAAAVVRWPPAASIPASSSPGCWPRRVRRSSSCRTGGWADWRPRCGRPGRSSCPGSPRAGPGTGPGPGTAAAGAGASSSAAAPPSWRPSPTSPPSSSLDDGSEALKEERSPTWHARDLAAERARPPRRPPHDRVAGRRPLEAPGPVLAPSRTVERAGWPITEVIDRRREAPGLGLFSSRAVAALPRRARGRPASSVTEGAQLRSAGAAGGAGRCASSTGRAGPGCWPAPPAATWPAASAARPRWPKSTAGPGRR